MGTALLGAGQSVELQILRELSGELDPLLSLRRPPQGRSAGQGQCGGRSADIHAGASRLFVAASKRLSGRDLAVPLLTAKQNLAAAIGCPHFTADLSIDVSLGSHVHLPRMDEFISTETNKL